MPNNLFEPGREKTGGRQKGVPNRTTQQMRDVMSAIHNKFLGQLEQDLNLMSPTSRWSILCKLAPFHMPTLSKNDNTNSSTGEVTITVEYLDNTPTRKGELAQTKPVEVDGPSIPNYLAMEDLDIQVKPTDNAA